LFLQAALTTGRTTNLGVFAWNYFGDVVVTPDPATKDARDVIYGYFVTFTSLRGPLPLMTTDPKVATVSRFRAGDAPFRRTVQVVQCTGLGDAPASSTFTIGTYTSMPLLSGASLADVADAWGQVTSMTRHNSSLLSPPCTDLSLSPLSCSSATAR
jgi:hypothetical protein